MPRSSSRHAGWGGRGTCPTTGKHRFRDHAEAVEALHSAQNARQRAELAGVASRRRERRAYSCAACNGFHLTSQSQALGGSPFSAAVQWLLDAPRRYARPRLAPPDQQTLQPNTLTETTADER